MPNRNVNHLDTIDNYEIIKTRKDTQLLIRSPEGANFILDLPVAKKLASILLYDETISEKFNIPETGLTKQLTAYEGPYQVDDAQFKQDRSLLAKIDGYSLLPTSSHGKQYIHLRKEGINFILSLQVLFHIVEHFGTKVA